MTFIDLLRAEARRALHRRLVRVLILIALVGTAVLGIVAFADSAGRTVAQMHADGTHPAVQRDWWVPGTGDGILIIAAFPLFIGGLIGGASVAGAEWRAGTVTTVLTWEPRRLRVHAARMGVSFVLAALIAVALQALFLAATVPAVLAHGTTAGTDAAWWLDLIGAVVRLALLTGATALLGGSLATLGRGTAFALGAVFVWMAVGEALVRGLKPRLAHLLLGENTAIVAQWGTLEGAPFHRPELLAAATVALYIGAIAALAAASFARRDVAATA